MEASLKPQTKLVEKFDVSNGFKGPSDKSCISQLTVEHPLCQSELNYNKHKQNLSYRMLRNVEGLHAPLKLSMELNAAQKVGRLPFLTSSNAQMDVLLGRDELLEFPDFLGSSEFNEDIRLPHTVMEKSLGML